ncbi:putative NBD/HSP70 family sugar kinase [Actinoplanes lutulentus]|uniref:Putative NBD/HSP70 family sugar kinase n=1 Tax=Actinoplanes lutulentus TaxID=1287878 RepID=A0A327ZHN9_9ACTN|nr:ROK family transcriptional regulator [Actinoplanes lutulentus]MBB2948001.1 putative NBD/HSP70 family sugar kinase [Actinoplanes lutulentus]RAK40118.1 putative NBD/HSP70 family sugar kinase [Actinoplanes lutulentus]
MGFTDVRATNLAVVLRHLRTNGPSSRAAIAASTGLNKATVSSLTSDLIDHRLLRETGSSGNRIGRPGTAVALDGSAYAAIGLQVAADRLTALAVDFAGEQVLLWHRALAAEGGRATGEIIALAQRTATRVRQQGRTVLGLTLAVPGLVDEDGTVRLSPALGWSDVDLRGLVASSLRQPGLVVTAANQAGLAAIAERRAENMIFVTGTAGIEAGLIVDGKLLHGARGFTGQIGRFALGPAGSPTLHDLAGIEPLVRRALPGFDPDSLTDLSPAVEQVIVQARAGDAAVLTALRDTGRHLGQGLAILSNLTDPSVIVLGDHYAALAEWIIPAANPELAGHLLAPGGAELVASELGLHAAALGGAISHLERVDSGRSMPITA